MKQLVQKLRDGSMHVLEVPSPQARPGFVLVQNHYSLISAGTEGNTVATARKSLIGKARERPEQLRQVIETLKQQGPVQTYRAVTKRLDAYSPLGYSTAGVVVDVGRDVRGFGVGDKVACAGAGYASHAEFVAVPANLCVPLGQDADLSLAAYNTLGAIALQGVRQAALQVGETCVVIGLGLLGQLTCLMLRASGVRCIGIDINPGALETAVRHCADAAFQPSDPTLPDAVARLTRGVNADAAIITAASSSTEPVNLAGKLLRKRGTVVIVGDVPTGFNREPDYYRKELSLKMSCSYGPGRYDLRYEERGFDYPAGYVRWTENRNMQAFQDMVARRVIDLGYMTTHRFAIDNAAAAYDIILGRKEAVLGVVLEYPAATAATPAPSPPSGRVNVGAARPSGEGVGIGFIGAGSYAMSHLLPNLPRDGVRLTGVSTASGTSSRTVAEKFGFAFAASTATDVIGDPGTSSVFIATRHDSHASLVTDALRAGRNVFVEKPLCLNETELHELLDAWRGHRPALMVGFNRRFSPLAAEIAETLGRGPMAMMYRVNAGAIPGETWIQDAQIGGGRIIGEVCHFVDLMMFLCGSMPTRVYASGLGDPHNLEDNVAINLEFRDGSIGTISYFANGPKSLPKEYLEVFKGGVVARLDDFRRLEIFGPRGPRNRKLLSQDKGQPEMTRRTVSAFKEGKAAPIPLAELLGCTLATFAAVESLRTGRSVPVEVPAM